MDKQRDWKGYWIGCTKLMAWAKPGYEPAPYYRKTFTCESKPGKAIVYLCGLGYHELYVNGVKADDRVLAPVVTQYEKRACYIAYDVTHLLKQGTNAIAVLLGNGWYNCHTREVWDFFKAPWRAFPKLLCDVEADGRVIASSDSTWKCHASPVVFDGLRNGETYDARLEVPGFSLAETDDSSWQTAPQTIPPGGELVEEEMEPVKVMRTIAPVKVIPIGNDANTLLLDFGVNMTGWCRIKVKGVAGQQVTLKYGEKIRALTNELDREELDMFVKEGEFQTDHYILKGAPEGECWEPRFTYHGFRYVELQFTGCLADVSAEARFIHCAFPQAGRFESSSDMLNTLQKITIQSYLSNFTGIPTDCPHREKNGWTGDAQLAMETGLWNFQCEKACTHFLELLADTQRPCGQLPGIAPSGGWGFEFSYGPAWDGLLFEYPWQMYLFRGNVENFRRFYGAMKRYLAYCSMMADGNLVRFGLGDWCPPDTSKMPPVELTSSGIWYQCVRRMAMIAGLLGYAGDKAGYERQSMEIKAAINRKYYKGNGIYANGEPTALGAALFLDFAEDGEAQAVADTLARIVRANQHRAAFGILGAKFVPRALADYGYADDALAVLTQEQFPGWGWWVRQGATTLWEHWDGRYSNNHIMFGDVSAWMYRYAAGVRPRFDGAGFRKFDIQPCFVRGLDFVRMSYDSPYGTIRSEWERSSAGQIHCRFEIPDGCNASVMLPGRQLPGATGTVECDVAL